MKKIFFDTGPLVTLALTDLLGTLKKLKDISNVEFYITEKVRREAVEKPLETRQFKFEALRILRLIESGVLQVYDNPLLEEKSEELINIANKIFASHGQNIEIVHFGEMQTLAAAIIEKADAVIVDERTTRNLVENPKVAGIRLERKLHTRIEWNKENMRKVEDLTGNLKILRSAELMVMAYEAGLLNEFFLDIKNPKETLLDGVLWAIKLSGCAISEQEIAEIVHQESKTF